MKNTLVLNAQSGNQESVATLLQQHQPLIRVLAQRVSPDPALQEDLHQAGIVGFMQALKRYDDSRGVKLTTYAVPWILGEMRAVLRNALQNRYVTDDLEAGYPLGTPVPSNAFIHRYIEHEYEIDFDSFTLHDAIRKLKYEEQIVVFLRFFREKTQKEVSTILGKSQPQISRVERCALNHLQQLLT